MQGHLIVARFIDGRVLKGVSLDVDTKKPICHLKTESGGTIEIPLAETKALFFVKSASGHAEYNEAREASPGDSRLHGTRRVKATFQDSEEIVGLMNRFPPITPYFFMLPIDPASNNIRMLVNRAALKDITEIPA